MPIKKIIGIKYVGRLVNCAQKGPEFNRYNLFFAENGRGKTTLCAVLRSLQTGQHEYITERKTLTAIWDEPTATIRIDGGQAKYEKNAWSSTVPEIAIFDATFVTQNVHAGEFIGRDHRTNLLQIIIGQAGLALAKKVNDLDEAIREKNGEIGSARKLVQQHLPKGVGIDAFINLPEDPDIDTKISTKTTELVAAKRANEIKTHAALSEVNIPILPANLLPTLGKTLADVSAEAERRLREQIANHEMHENGEAWLSEGVVCTAVTN